ncbi:putative tetratricopeptide-like helical domain superfamily [Helianthus annuus]|nr:putative tetratricopeptide-like helical domain superfamily [Helianthus annuus]
MKNIRVISSLVSYYFLLSLIHSTDYLSINRLVHISHPPDLATYSTIIHGLVLVDRVFEAVDLFKKLLRDKLCDPDQVMYGTVINGLCKVRHTSKALELLTFMESDSCKPSVEQYSVVIDSLCVTPRNFVSNNVLTRVLSLHVAFNI